jgi:hypothetical protein
MANVDVTKSDVQAQIGDSGISEPEVKKLNDGGPLLKSVSELETIPEVETIPKVETISEPNDSSELDTISELETIPEESEED